MRSLTLITALSLGTVFPLAAQNTQATRRDTTVAVQEVEMRDRIQENFLARAKEEMGLNEEQMTKLRAAEQRVATKRRTLEQEMRRLNGVLADQLRPGIAAKEDVVTKSLDSLGTLRVSYAQTFKEEQRDLATFLTPVQRAQFHRMRERMVDRVREVRQDRSGRTGNQARPRER
jgi:hypothetical protein